jgi:NADP-dependent 3-hydroxy acid dehydrogenase YdfG
MKIAITGGTAGIGQALSNIYENEGHEVLRLSRRTGHNIRVTPKLADIIEPCDMFVNNAQVGFAQTELLFEMAKRWEGTRKTIMVISTQMALCPVSSIAGIEMNQYRVQKVALEEAIHQIRNNGLKIEILLVRPGNIATDPSKTVPPAADVNIWANTLNDIFKLARANNLRIPDISLGPI